MYSLGTEADYWNRIAKADKDAFRGVRTEVLKLLLGGASSQVTGNQFKLLMMIFDRTFG